MDNGRGRPRGGGRVLTAGAHGFMQCPCEFFLLAFCKECGLGTAVFPEKFFSPQKSMTPFLDSLMLFLQPSAASVFRILKGLLVREPGRPCLLLTQVLKSTIGTLLK